LDSVVPNLAANRSTARRWIQAEATVVSLANILTMPGNCTKCRAFRQSVTVHNTVAAACSNSSTAEDPIPQGIVQNKHYLREPVLAGEHGAQGVGSPGQVEQVAVEEPESNVGGAALCRPFGLNKRMGRT
jgi:hypothetical protein